MYPIWTNFAASTLGAAVDSVTTTVLLANGSRFPQPGEINEKFTIVVGDGGPNSEIMLVTARVGNILTVNRGFDQTAAKPWGGGTPAVHQPTAEVYRWMSRAALDFNRRFIGFAAVDPVTDGNGDPLLPGAFYYNTVQGAYKSWGGHGWASSAMPVATGGQKTITGTTYTLTPADNATTIRFTAATPITVTLPGDIPDPMQSELFQGGDGTVTVVSDGNSVLECGLDRDLLHRSTAYKGATINVWMDDNPTAIAAHWWIRGQTQVTE